MLRRLPDPAGRSVAVIVDGHSVTVGADDTAATAALLADLGHTRTSPVTGEPRAPFCMMGVCYECLMMIDGEPSRQACMVIVREGMRIDRQSGARLLQDEGIDAHG